MNFFFCRKAIYDILIELAATAKLLPSNYTLKLFTTTTNHGESNFNENDEDCVDKLIEYTPNQSIGQLSMFVFHFWMNERLLLKERDRVKKKER